MINMGNKNLNLVIMVMVLLEDINSKIIHRKFLIIFSGTKILSVKYIIMMVILKMVQYLEVLLETKIFKVQANLKI